MLEDPYGLFVVAESAAIIKHFDGEPFALRGALSQFKGLFVTGDGWGGIGAVVVGCAERFIGAGEVRIQGDGLFEELFGGPEIAELQTVQPLGVGSQGVE